MRIMPKSSFQLTAPQRQPAATKTASTTLGALQTDAFTPSRPVQFAGPGSSKMTGIQSHSDNTFVPHNYISLTQLAQAGSCSRELTEHLQAKGGDAYVSGEDGWDELARKSKGRNPERVKALLDWGSNVNSQDGYGITALMYTAWNNFPEMAQVLLDRNANPNIQDGQGNTALTAAIVGKNTEMAKLLLDHEADIHHQDKNGDTALSVAASWGARPIVKLLLDKGAKIDHQNKDGETPLMWAAYRGHRKTVELLLANGANPLIVDNKGRNPQVRAERVGRDKIAKILKKAEKTFQPAKASDSQYHAESSNAQLRK